LEDKIKKLEDDWAGMEQQVREANEARQSLANDLQIMTSERDRVLKEKGSLEVSGMGR